LTVEFRPTGFLPRRAPREKNWQRTFTSRATVCGSHTGHKTHETLSSWPPHSIHFTPAPPPHRSPQSPRCAADATASPRCTIARYSLAHGALPPATTSMLRRPKARITAPIGGRASSLPAPPPWASRRLCRIRGYSGSRTTTTVRGLSGICITGAPLVLSQVQSTRGASFSPQICSLFCCQQGSIYVHSCIKSVSQPPSQICSFIPLPTGGSMFTVALN
jgi:hypothetical protein